MTILLAFLFLLLGSGGGALHFAAISKDAGFLVQGGPAARTIPLRMGRLALTMAILVFAARQGRIELVAAALGFVAARHIVIARLGPAR